MNPDPKGSAPAAGLRSLVLGQGVLREGVLRQGSLGLTVLGLAVLIGLSVGLRAFGLTWGLPNAGRFYPYHPDESVMLNAACHISPLWLQFKPHFYNYGTFYITLSRLCFDLLAPSAGWQAVPRFDLPAFGMWVKGFARLLLVARWVNVAMGAAAVAATWGLGRVLFRDRAGWWAGGFLAVAPLPVLLGHYMTVDIPAACLSTCALLLAALALRRPDRRGRWILASAAVCGLATGTKYNVFPVFFSLLVPLTAMVQSASTGKRRSSWATAAAVGAGAALVCAAAFLAATPGAVLEPRTFRHHLADELGHNATGQGLLYLHTLPAPLYHLGISLPIGMEWPLYLLALAGLAWSLRQRRAEDVLLWLFLIPSFLLLAPAERKYVRYVAPLIPPLVVLAARLLDEQLDGRWGRAWWGIGALAGAAALASTVAHLGVLAAPDSRDQAAAYLRQHSAPFEMVALASDPWFYTPPLDPTAGCVKVAQFYGGPPVWDRGVGQGVARPDVCPLAAFRVLAPPSVPVPDGAAAPRLIRKYRPERVLLTDYETEDPDRIRRFDPAFRDPRLDVEEILRQDYHLEREFRPRPSLLGFTWWRRGTPPHDWRYFMTAVRIYARN